MIAPTIENMYAIHCSDALLLREPERDPEDERRRLRRAPTASPSSRAESLTPATARTGTPTG